MSKYSFIKGYKKIPIGQAKELKNEIMSALKIKTIPSWHSRLRGTIEPKVSEAEAIENIFEKYGIPKTEIWG